MAGQVFVTLWSCNGYVENEILTLATSSKILHCQLYTVLVGMSIGIKWDQQACRLIVTAFELRADLDGQHPSLQAVLVHLLPDENCVRPEGCRSRRRTA